MKKAYGIAVIIMAVTFAMSGCGTQVPDMTEEQTALVTEYATNLLIKYNKLDNRNLLDDEQLAEAEKKEAEEAEKQRKKEEAAQAYLAAQNETEAEQSQGDSADNSSSAGNSNAISDLAAFYGLDGFSISYSGYDLCTSYPDDSREDYFMAMDATEGKQLCIVKFAVSNVSSEAIDFDMFEKRAVFYLTIDGSDKVQVQSTLLLDDLASYKGMIEAGSTEDMILVFEISDIVTQVGSMELTAKYQDARGVMVLQQ